MVGFRSSGCDLFRWFGGFVLMGLVVDFGACCGEDDEEELVRAKGFGNLNPEIAFLRRSSLTQSEELSPKWMAKQFSLGLGIGFFFWV